MTETVRIEIISALNKVQHEPNERYQFENQDLEETLGHFLTKFRNQFKIKKDLEFTMKIKQSWKEEGGDEKRGI